jgi:hypothetical protein
MNIGFFAIGLANLSFAEADAWIEMSGAKSYEPFLYGVLRRSPDEEPRELAS